MCRFSLCIFFVLLITAGMSSDCPGLDPIGPSAQTGPHCKKSKIQEIRGLVARHKNHPALLVWSLGNEINLEGADTRAAWQFVNELAPTIKDRVPTTPSSRSLPATLRP